MSGWESNEYAASGLNLCERVECLRNLPQKLTPRRLVLGTSASMPNDSPCFFFMLQFQEYFEQFPQANGSTFLFNAYTGEAIYDVGRWGSPLPDAHKLSHWFEPTALVPPLDIEDTGRVHINDVSS